MQRKDAAAGMLNMHKASPVELATKALGDDGEFEGYASTFGNVDRGGDVMVAGAFTESLQRRPISKVKMFREHDPRQIIGVWTEAREEPTGLYVKGKLILSTDGGREAYELMRADALDGLSIGFRTMADEFDRDPDGRQIRKIIKVDLMEISVVTFPMNESAAISNVKAADKIQTKREFEAFLREAGGFSRAAAKAIASHGFKSSEPREEDDAADGLLAALKKARSGAKV